MYTLCIYYIPQLLSTIPLVDTIGTRYKLAGRWLLLQQQFTGGSRRIKEVQPQKCIQTQEEDRNTRRVMEEEVGGQVVGGGRGGGRGGGGGGGRGRGWGVESREMKGKDRLVGNAVAM